MITHNDKLSSVADKTFLVRKDTNGISTAIPMIIDETQIDYSDIDKMEAENE